MPEPGAEVAGRARRDALGQACFLLHFAVMLYIVTGWAVPQRKYLIFYLVFVPAVAVQWQCNRNSCVLNNLESLMRTGRWRDLANREEGAWLLTLANNTLRLRLRAAQVDVLVYVLLLALWGLGLGHLLHA